MHWIYYILLIVIAIVGLALNILGLPGLWVLLLGVIIYAWVTTFGVYVGLWTIGILFALAVIAELVEFLAGAAGSKKAGGGKRAMAGAVVGGLVGGIAGTLVITIPVVGTIIGAVVGSFAGAAGVQRLIEADNTRALKVGTGAAVGRFLGIVIKLGFGIAMLLITLVIAFPISLSNKVSSPSSTAPTTQHLTTQPTTQL